VSIIITITIIIIIIIIIIITIIITIIIISRILEYCRGTANTATRRLLQTRQPRLRGSQAAAQRRLGIKIQHRPRPRRHPHHAPSAPAGTPEVREGQGEAGARAEALRPGQAACGIGRVLARSLSAERERESRRSEEFIFLPFCTSRIDLMCISA
jgi:hypothetical protein